MLLFNLCLYLVEKYNGRKAALYCATLLQLDIERNIKAFKTILKKWLA
jgi:hypothetical protein